MIRISSLAILFVVTSIVQVFAEEIPPKVDNPQSDFSAPVPIPDSGTKPPQTSPLAKENQSIPEKHAPPRRVARENIIFNGHPTVEVRAIPEEVEAVLKKCNCISIAVDTRNFYVPINEKTDLTQLAKTICNLKNVVLCEGSKNRKISGRISLIIRTTEQNGKQVVTTMLGAMFAGQNLTEDAEKKQEKPDLRALPGGRKILERVIVDEKPAVEVRAISEEIEAVLKKGNCISISVALHNVILPINQRTDFTRLAKTICNLKNVVLYEGPKNRKDSFRISLIIRTSDQNGKQVVTAMIAAMFAGKDPVDKVVVPDADEPAPAIAAEPVNKIKMDLNPNSKKPIDPKKIVEACVTALLSAWINETASLTLAGEPIASKEMIKQLHKALQDVYQEPGTFVESWVSDSNDSAIVISALIHFPEGPRGGHFVITLSNSKAGWLVKNIDFTEDAKLTTLLKKLKQSEARSNQDPRDVVEAHVTAMLASDFPKANSLLENHMPKNNLGTPSISQLRMAYLTITEVLVSNEGKMALAVSENVADPIKKGFGNSQNKRFVFSVLRVDEKWVISGIRFFNDQETLSQIAKFQANHLDAKAIPPKGVSIELRTHSDVPYRRTLEVLRKLNGIKVSAFRVVVDDKQTDDIVAAISAAVETPHEEIKLIIERLKDAGIKKVSFAVKQDLLEEPMDAVESAPPAPQKINPVDPVTWQLTQNYRQLKSDKNFDKKDLTQLKVQLHKRVTSEFTARQQQQRAELSRLEQRLKQIQNLIDSREQLKEKIINRRVEELLNPALQWEVSAPTNPQKISGSWSQTNTSIVVPPESKDPTKLEGHWELVGVSGPGILGFGRTRVRIIGNTWQQGYYTGGTTYDYTYNQRFVITDETIPNRMDRFTQAKDKTFEYRYLYRLKGDQLEIAINRGNKEVRPTSFDAPTTVIHTWKRIPEKQEFNCPLHPEIQQAGPGRCPICAMELRNADPLIGEWQLEEVKPDDGRFGKLPKKFGMTFTFDGLKMTSKEESDPDNIKIYPYKLLPDNIIHLNLLNITSNNEILPGRYRLIDHNNLWLATSLPPRSKPPLGAMPDASKEDVDNVMYQRFVRVTKPKEISEGLLRSSKSGTVDMVAPSTEVLPASEAEKSIARLVVVFFQDLSRRSIPAVLVDSGSHTLIVIAGPAKIVPDGTAPAIDRTFLEIPGQPPVSVKYLLSTKELQIFRTEKRLTNYFPTNQVKLKTGDYLSAILPGSSIQLLVKPRAARVVALDSKAVLNLPERGITLHYDKLVEVDCSLPEGTPLFKDGKLVGLTLLGTRFLGAKVKKSYVVPVEIIVALCNENKAIPNEPVSKGVDIQYRKMIPATAALEPSVKSHITIISTTENEAIFIGDLDSTTEIVLQIAKSAHSKKLEWTKSFRAGGPFTATINHSDKIKLDNDKLGQGIVFVVGVGKSKSQSNIAMTKNDPILNGRIQFRPEKATKGQAGIELKENLIVFADIKFEDGSLAPVSLLIRKKSIKPR